jgi:D-sedoheptulose 7-phosphate isomerase
MSTAIIPEMVVKRYFDTLAELLHGTEVTTLEGTSLTLDQGIDWMRQAARETHAGGNKIMFVGNGGSAGISSHLAIDYSKNGGLRATAFNDPAALTCLGNDLGYDQVFAKQLEMHLRSGDLLVAISSSGRSANILNAAAVARSGGARIVTFSGFGAGNALRRAGDVNFYVGSSEYGFVEVAHLSLCHAVLDIEMGWQGGSHPTAAREAELVES